MQKQTTLLLSLLFCALSYYSQAENNLQQAQQFMQSQTSAFEENKGQVTGEDANQVKYLYKNQGLSIFLLNNGLAYQFSKTHYPEGYQHLDKFASPEQREQMQALQKDIRTETYRMDVRLVNANPNASITSEGKSQDYTQYYNHNTLNVHRYNKITYHNVYPGIDWVIYQTKHGVKYDFVVHPGANPNQIQLQTRWVEELKRNPDGSLSLKNRMGSITEQSPVSFQNGKDIKTSFKVENNRVSFNLDNYDNTLTLTIDPSLVWATYYGGSGNDYGRSCAVDPSGNVYLAGDTYSSTGIAMGGHQNTWGGGKDAFLVQFNSSGIRQWATYYGGTGYDEGTSCAVDPSGNVYLAGITSSSTDIAMGGHQNMYGGHYDAFLVKFNSSGVRQWATYYGGSDDDFGYSCAVDGLGNVYLAGYTFSTTDIAMGGHQNTLGAYNSDAFLVQFNSAGVRQWATYYGGSGIDYGNSCAVDPSGNVYLTGETSSSTDIAMGGHQNTFGGGIYLDAFLVKFNTSGVRQWATYYGGDGSDGGYSCAVDPSGNVYLAGYTYSNTDIAMGGHQNTRGGSYDAFLVQFNSSGVRQWATYYGGSGIDYGRSCAVDPSGNVYLAGYTQSSTDIAMGGHQNTRGGSYDAFLVQFNSSGVRQWATYYGGSGIDYGRSCAVDPSGNVYLAGYTQSNTDIAMGGHQNTWGGNWDAFLANFNGGNALCTPTITISSNQGTSICQGQQVIYSASITNGGTTPTYQWKRNGNNVATGLFTYTSSANNNGDIITCELTSNEACASPATVSSNTLTMTVNSLITPTITISSNQGTSICQGQQVIYSASITNGGTAPTYQWKRNGNNVATGLFTYTSSANNNGDVITCELTSNEACASPATVSSNALNVTVNPLPNISIVLNADSLVATAGYSNYVWELNNTVLSGVNSNAYIPMSSGSYEVEVSDVNGCTNTATFGLYTVNGPETPSTQTLNMYPNPNPGTFTLSFATHNPRKVLMYNSVGQLVYQTSSNNAQIQVHVPEIASGIYQVRVEQEGGFEVQTVLIRK